MRTSPILLKLGGSVITDKSKVMTPNNKVIKRLAKEIHESKVESIIVVHGGGSYGHPMAKKHRITEGLTHSSQVLGFCETHEAMVELNTLVVNAFLKNGLPVFSMSPSSFIVTRRGRIKVMEEELFVRAMGIGLMPILYGDSVLDCENGFAILSGDQIVSELATRCKAEKIIMGVDVDGLYTSDPKIDKSAKLIRSMTLRDLKLLKCRLGEANSTDVTGGMMGKIFELEFPIAEGIEALIVNALKPGNICKALKGEDVIGTQIVKEQSSDWQNRTTQE